MTLLKRILAFSVTTLIAMASGVLVAQADSTPTVYDTPGGQISNGRLWDTTCEKYSSNVVRCRANIWATQVQYRGGRYVPITGWTFNNLSYLPSTHVSWAGNNLARTNDRWKSGGRTWRTECDTATTGRGGCRSYVWTKQTRLGDDGYVSRHAWVFNSLVLFSSRSVPAVTSVPGWIIDQSRLDVTGLGPLRIGTPMKDLVTLGYFAKHEDWGPWPYGASEALENRGVSTGTGPDEDLKDLLIDVRGIRTVDGAQVGMTLGQIRSIYGTRLRLEVKEGHYDMHTAVVQSGGKELVFWNTFDRPLLNSDRINYILARESSPYLY